MQKFARSKVYWIWVAALVALVACSSEPVGMEPAEGTQSQSLAASPPPPDGDAQENRETVDTPPPGYLFTPGGRLLHASCVHEIPNGSTVDDDDNVHDSKGSLLMHLDACAYPVLERRTHRASADAAIPGFTGYIDQATQVVPSGATTWNFLQADVAVPNWGGSNGETFFYWNGLYSPSNTNFIQPVLQWGHSAAGGGNSWAIASWGFRPHSSNGVFTSLVGVSSQGTPS